MRGFLPPHLVFRLLAIVARFLASGLSSAAKLFLRNEANLSNENKESHFAKCARSPLRPRDRAARIGACCALSRAGMALGS
jgi:hypothetical protein